VNVRGADDEPDELELHVYQKLLEDPKRWWTATEFYSYEPARARDVMAQLADTGWLTADEHKRFRLTDEGAGALTWIVQTGGRERGVMRTFLWEGGTAARQMYRSHHGKRHTFVEGARDELGDLSAADFDQAGVHGFWWTLPRYGVTAARIARLERRRYRRRLPPASE
jgi:hypothetical protein